MRTHPLCFLQLYTRVLIRKYRKTNKQPLLFFFLFFFFFFFDYIQYLFPFISPHLQDLHRFSRQHRRESPCSSWESPDSPPAPRLPSLEKERARFRLGAFLAQLLNLRIPSSRPEVNYEGHEAVPLLGGSEAASPQPVLARGTAEIFFVLAFSFPFLLLSSFHLDDPIFPH